MGKSPQERVSQAGLQVRLLGTMDARLPGLGASEERVGGGGSGRGLGGWGGGGARPGGASVPDGSLGVGLGVWPSPTRWDQTRDSAQVPGRLGAQLYQRPEHVLEPGPLTPVLPSRAQALHPAVSHPHPWALQALGTREEDGPSELRGPGAWTHTQIRRK